MPNPTAIIIKALEPFAPHFCQKRTWDKAKTLVTGAILTTGKRMVSSILRTMGLQDESNFNQYHHVLSRAVWSPMDLSRTLLQMLIALFFATGKTLVFGIDETIERRWGQKISTRGIYRDPVRSSHSHFAKTSGLRWISVMLLTPISWAQRIWALPILTVLSPSQRYYEQRGRQHKPLLERALQALKVLKSWLPQHRVVVVGDNSYSAIDFLHGCQQANVTFITRLRLDAALYDPAPPYNGRGRPRKKGDKQVKLEQRLLDDNTSWQTLEVIWYDGRTRTIQIASGISLWFHYGKPAVPIRWVLIRDPQDDFEPLALLSTCQTDDPLWIIQTFISRWCVEVTFEEARRHLGLETQRQWSDNAIARTTPILLGLFSWITLVTEQLHRSDYPIVPRYSAWYHKSYPTFSDAIATLRQHLWQTHPTFLTSPSKHDILKIPCTYFNTLIQTLCYAV